MVRSLAFCLFTSAVAVSDQNCPGTPEDDVISALQQNVQRVDVSVGHEDVSVSLRLNNVFQQLADGAHRICVAAAEGEVVPVAGVLTTSNGVQELAQGRVVGQSGRFCAEAAAVSMLQRSSGMATAADVERSLAAKKQKDTTVEGATKSKKGSGSPSPSDGGDGNGPEPTPEPEPTPSSPSGGGNGGHGGQDPTPSPSPGGGEPPSYGSLPSCDNDYWEGYNCQGENQYFCNQADIEENCGSLDNACCADADGSCEDGDDDVRCKTNPYNGNGDGGDGGDSTPPDYGTVEMCGDRATSDAYCQGTNQYGCTQSGIADMCGDRQPCCADTDGSCTDGDDHVKCLQDTSAPEPPEYGELDACGNRALAHSGNTICSGTNRYGCTQTQIIDVCGNLESACCKDTDGSCIDGDDNVACLDTR